MLDIETTGLLPWHGDRITCIGAKDSNDGWFQEALADEDDDCELELLRLFFTWCLDEDRRPFKFVTYNGMEFDIPFILTRLALTGRNKFYQILIDDVLQIASKSDIDLYQEMKKLTGKRLSLDTVAKLMGCSHKSGNGENAIELYKQGKIKELKEYNHQDVKVTEEVFLRWRGLHERKNQNPDRDQL